MNIAQLINHPELLNKETLYELRNMLAMYPYHQPARLLLLKNLFLLHDPTFDSELRKAAIYISDRTILFQLVEEKHYQLNPQNQQQSKELTPTNNEGRNTSDEDTDRTTSLIDSFLEQIPKEDEETENKQPRKPTPADATVDYVAFLLESEEEKDKEDETPQLKGQDLIDDFINKEGGKITLQDETEYEPEEEDDAQEGENEDNGYFTETLARIYIKQGRYTKALEIIKRLNLVYPKKNRYFADQIRFLEKLIINNSQK